MTKRPRFTLRAAAAGLGLAATLVLAAPADAPPKAAVTPGSETMFGVEVADPYRLLEDVKSPSTQAWLKGQGEFAAETLARIDGRDEIAKRIEVLGRAAGTLIREIVRMPGDRVYYLRRLAGESQLKLVLRSGTPATERVLVDPDQLARAAGVPHAINYFKPSWDGTMLAYGVSAAGSEAASLHVLDIASGKELLTAIPRVHEGLLHWTPDSRQLSFNQVRDLPSGTPDTETYLDSTVFIVEPRAAGALPRPLFGPLVNPLLKLDRIDVGEVIFAADSSYMVARTTDTTLPEGRLFVAPLGQLATGPIQWRPVAVAADKITQVELRGDTLYLRTYDKAPRGRVLALPLADPVLKKAVEAIPEPEAGVLQKFGLGKDALYADILRGFNVRVRRYHGAKPGQGVDAAPELAGTTRLVEDAAHTHYDAWAHNVTWTDPERIFAVAAGGMRDTGLLSNAPPPGLPEIEVTEVLVKSHDGARVPLAILAKKGAARNGDSPTLLVGYGAYGSTITANFDPRVAAWIERGGVLAFANVRGSGALGDAWYKAGFKKNKPNTWKDGVACARYLIAQKYASPATLGIWGTSAGGIFVGRSVTSAPELFAAAIFDVGMLDAVRSEESANGITNISEFGSAKVAADFPALLEMSTYHQIKPKTNYPAVMLIHGLNDPRVDVWHSAKTAARLQASTTSDRPILLRLDAQAGHGVGATAEQRASKQADIYAFLLWQFGQLKLKP